VVHYINLQALMSVKLQATNWMNGDHIPVDTSTFFSSSTHPTLLESPLIYKMDTWDCLPIFITASWCGTWTLYFIYL